MRSIRDRFLVKNHYLEHFNHRDKMGDSSIEYHIFNSKNLVIDTDTLRPTDQYCIQRNHPINQKSNFRKVPISSTYNHLLKLLFCSRFISHNHTIGSSKRKSNVFTLFLIIILFSLSSLTRAQQSTCPNAKQINDLKPPNVNLNCDCTQTADGHKTAGWEIMCYSIENTHNSESPLNNADKPTTLSSLPDRTENGNRVETIEEVTGDNLSLSNFGDERVENDNFFAERLSVNEGNLDYGDEMSLYRSVPVAFTIKYSPNQQVSIECSENVPNFKPAMFQEFKIDEIDSFKIVNCALPEVPFSLLFYRTSSNTVVPNLRSLRLETLHTQGIDINQFKKLFVNLESLEILTIDNYELDTNGKGLRMKRQIPYRNGNMMSLVNFNSRLNGPSQLSPPKNITNSKQFFTNKILRSTALNNALQNAINNNANGPNGNSPMNGGMHHTVGGQSTFNRFKSTPFNFVTPPSGYSPISNGHHFESNRLMNVRAVHNQKPPPPPPSFESLLTTMSSGDEHSSSMIFRHFDAISTPTTNSPPLSRFSNFNTFMRVSRPPNHSNPPNLNLGNSFSSFQPSTFPSTNSPLSFAHNANRFTTSFPPTSSGIGGFTSTTTSTSTTSTTTSTTTTTPPSSTTTSSTPISSTIVRTGHSNMINSNDSSLLTSDSRLISNHMASNAIPPSTTTNKPMTYSLNLLMSNSSISPTLLTSPNNSTDTFISLENHNQPNRIQKTPLLTNMLNKRNNTTRNPVLSNLQATGQLNREASARKLNLNFNNYFPNLKVLKIRSLLTNYDKDNAYFVKEMLNDLKVLETFEFSKNIIYVLPNQMFSSLVRLRTLFLNHNQIQQIERDALADLKMCETLELENNDLKEIHEDTFRSLVNLKQIKLKRNKFQSLPERLFNRNRNLVEIDLSQNPELSSLPDHLLKNLNQLHNLSVYDCQLNQISTNAPLFFANAPHLRMLYMRNNRLKYLNMRNLFAANSELIKLDLSYNDITYLSPEIFSINSSSLIEFNLYANNLVEVPINLFSNLKNLKILNLGFNNLTEVDVSIFFALKNLEELDLSKNLLTSINPKKFALPFGMSPNLQTINLANNKLTSFANEFGVINWSLYLMLAELNLSHNLFEGDLQLPVFYSPKMKLDLRQNQFTTILVDQIEMNERATSIELRSKDAGNSRTAKSQVSIYLAHNPINCDCRLFNFVNYTRSTNAKYQNLIEKITFDTEYLECQQPEKLSRTLIEQLNDADLNCPITDNKVCPNTCACKYITKYKQMDIDCQQRSLTRPPIKVLTMSNYDEITLDGEQKLSNRQIDLISLRFQHNKIKNLDTFNSLLYRNNTIKRRSTEMVVELYLDNNTIDTIPDGFFNLTINSLNSATNLIPANSTVSKNRKQSNTALNGVHLKTLSITNNQLEYVPVDFLNKLVKLTGESRQLPQFKLYLSSNPFNCTPVQYSMNRKLSATEQSDDKQAITDECYVKEMKNWLTQNYNYIGDLGDINCYDNSNRNASKQLIQYSDDQLCPREMEDKSTTLLLLYICIGITLILFIVTIFYFKNRQTILAFVYIHIHPIFFICGFHEEDLDEDKIYDAFISYSSHDRDVVMQLIEHLEKPSKQTNNSINYLQSRNGLPTFHEASADKIVPDMNISNESTTTPSTAANGLKVPTSLKSNNSNLNTSNELSMNYGMNTLNSSALQQTATNDNRSDQFFKLCVHERDWLPGQLISWNIINSVRNSRRTILVLSRSFIESIWFKIEFHTAYYQMLEDKMDRLIVIVKGELPEKEQLDKDLSFLLSTKTYLVWGEKYFWQKLKYSLPHKRAFKEKNKAIKPLINGNNLKLHDFGTYSTTPASLNSLTNRNTLYPNKMSSKAKYMEECINNAISDYYKLEKKPTNSTEGEASNRKDNGYDLEKKMKSNKPSSDDKYAGQVNLSYENETETET